MKKNNTATKSPRRKETNRRSDRITIGMDLGDKTRRYCMLDDSGEVITERSVASTKKGMLQSFGAARRSGADRGGSGNEFAVGRPVTDEASAGAQ